MHVSDGLLIICNNSSSIRKLYAEVGILTFYEHVSCGGLYLLVNHHYVNVSLSFSK